VDNRDQTTRQQVGCVQSALAHHCNTQMPIEPYGRARLQHARTLHRRCPAAPPWPKAISAISHQRSEVRDSHWGSALHRRPGVRNRRLYAAYRPLKQPCGQGMGARRTMFGVRAASSRCGGPAGGGGLYTGLRTARLRWANGGRPRWTADRGFTSQRRSENRPAADRRAVPRSPGKAHPIKD
jgi:hypothetical protein